MFFNVNNGTINEHEAFYSTGVSANSSCSDLPNSRGSGSAAQSNPCDTYARPWRAFCSQSGHRPMLSPSPGSCVTFKYASYYGSFQVNDAVYYDNNVTHTPGVSTGRTGAPAGDLMQYQHTYFVLSVALDGTMTLARNPGGTCIVQYSGASDTQPYLTGDTSWSAVYLQCAGTCPAVAGSGINLTGSKMRARMVTVAPDTYNGASTSPTNVAVQNAPKHRSPAYPQNLIFNPLTTTVTTTGNSTGYNQGGTIAIATASDDGTT